ncbi:hypothetical protein TTHERM_000609459 (macronuclear) [Tetrahymena thermophila SB210]|uniref:Uncharacterized protein n=1 Tax=Tetrahymena thermophila (strain SB210) TaxID=312017 RepID=W7XG12_TETTS|nr:hypothetical protein TTHERM_000609459 [Tetrahymena thermophila SB210]EWS75828.1 hypothetical protein TTHERM_000609459 [Tetrahymena thermophila SB210]|eukprot:XP_012651642.1 hypothetical protein TTHERM_000609459 [Tetrahymena thermophila SB210]
MVKYKKEIIFQIIFNINNILITIIEYQVHIKRNDAVTKMNLQLTNYFLSSNNDQFYRCTELIILINTTITSKKMIQISHQFYQIIKRNEQNNQLYFIIFQQQNFKASNEAKRFIINKKNKTLKSKNRKNKYMLSKLFTLFILHSDLAKLLNLSK